jgi:hypothetical protein
MHGLCGFAAEKAYQPSGHRCADVGSKRQGNTCRQCKNVFMKTVLSNRNYTQVAG